MKYFYLTNSLQKQPNKNLFKINRQILAKKFLNITFFKIFFMQVFSYIFNSAIFFKQLFSKTLKVFTSKWFLRRKKHKRHYYRGRFFYLRKQFKKVMFKRFKKTSFIKKIIKLKQFLSLKNTLLKSYKTAKNFSNYFLSSFSFKFLFIYTLLLAPQFRRYIGIISTIFSDIKTNYLQSHFNLYTSVDGK